ncbi:hypothetical protein [Kingella oralis]|nr:hypothetical protein [Kingella oralis]
MIGTRSSNPWYHALVAQFSALAAAPQRLRQQYPAERDIELFARAG